MNKTQPSAKRHFIKQTWFQILFWGLILFFATEKIMVATGNPNFIPTVIMLGSFLVPVVFVAYIFERGSMESIPLATIAFCFLVGGVLGTISASALEFELRQEVGFVPLIGVGLAEEASKLIFPVAIYLRGQYRSEFTGLALGVASGMGFAALETMGYGLVSLIQSKGDINSLIITLVIRGLLSPAGHAAWTGFVCAILWRQRERAGGHNVIDWAVIGAFVLAAVLHALWDTFQSQPIATFGGFIEVEILSAVVALTSLGLLIFRTRRSSRHELEAGSR